MARYDYPGQFEIDGVIFSKAISKSSLLRTRDELILDPPDLVVADYPKSGTTWAGQVLHAIDFGVKQANERTANLSDSYMPFIDFLPADPSKPSFYDVIVSRSPPRRIKTHLYVDYFKRLLKDVETSPKFISIYRNPKDTLVSYFYMHKIFSDEFDAITWDEYFQIFKEKKLLWGDIFDYHLGWWEYRDHPKVLHMHYEDLHTHPAATVKKMAEFVGRTVSEEDVTKILEMTTFEKMKARGLNSYLHDAHVFSEKITPFFRKGVKGDWINHFSQEQSDYIDEMIKTKCDPVGLKYSF